MLWVRSIFIQYLMHLLLQTDRLAFCMRPPNSDLAETACVTGPDWPIESGSI
jgi:hypothetical protein